MTKASIILTLCCAAMFLLSQESKSQITKLKIKENMQQVLIDKFFVPANAKEEFIQRMNYNTQFITKLQGFVKGETFEQTDEKGNFMCVTVNFWENDAFFNKAKEAVQAEFKRIGFIPNEFYQRLNIKLERGAYHPMDN